MITCHVIDASSDPQSFNLNINRDHHHPRYRCRNNDAARDYDNAGPFDNGALEAIGPGGTASRRQLVFLFIFMFLLFINVLSNYR